MNRASCAHGKAGTRYLEWNAGVDKYRMQLVLSKAGRPHRAPAGMLTALFASFF